MWISLNKPLAELFKLFEWGERFKYNALYYFNPVIQRTLNAIILIAALLPGGSGSVAG